MPYPEGHRDETRRRILDSARKLLNRNGLAGVSIDEIMAGAGLTRGGFYSYFSSKEELYAEAITHFMAGAALPQWQCNVFELPRESNAFARAILDAYLSRAHMADIEESCPIVGLATDVARSVGPVRTAYRQVLDMLIDIFTTTMGPDTLSPESATPNQDRQRALALAALCVGGIVLARAVDDAALAEDLRAAAHRYGVALAGWRQQTA